MHQRVNSNSTRIAIPPSPVQAGSTKNDKSHIQHRGSRTHLLAGTAASSSQLQSLSRQKQPDVSRSSSKAAKSTRQRILYGLLGSLALYILVLRNGGISTYFHHTSAEADIQAHPEGVVDRSVMDKLAALDAAMGYKDEDEIEAREADRLPSRYTSNPDSPPPIRAIPNTKKKNNSLEDDTANTLTAEEEEEHARQADLIPAKELDAHTCRGQRGGCKFLFAAWLGEQETKAQMHLHQLGLLAIALDRILVLPNVSKSRMMSCGQHPFEFYYAADSLENLGVPTISFSAFADWSAKRSIPPSAQIISVANTKPELPKGALEVDSALDARSIPNASKRKLCLEPPRTYLEFEDYSPLAIYPPAAWYKTPEGSEGFGQLLINTLSSQQVLKRSWRPSSHKGQPPSPDVLVFNYELRYPAITPQLVQKLRLDSTSIGPLLPFSHFRYSSIWSDLADQVVSNLSPFVAIHWRQETLPSSSIAPCGEALIDKLVDMLSQRFPTIKTVYLATDYPIEDLQNGRDGVTSHSGTFSRLITEEHHTAMQRFLSLFKSKLTVPLGARLTTLDAEQANLRLPVELQQMLDLPAGARAPKPNQRVRKLDLAEIDPGLLGIIDKKVAMQAQVFMRGQPLLNKDYQDTACAKESSFTKQISEARKDLIDRGNTKLWNDVEIWSRNVP